MSTDLYRNTDGDHDGAVIVVHYRDEASLLTTPAHAFGPFVTESEARAFELNAEDDCYKVMLDLIVPPVTEATIAAAADAVKSALGLVEADEPGAWPRRCLNCMADGVAFDAASPAEAKAHDATHQPGYRS